MTRQGQPGDRGPRVSAQVFPLLLTVAQRVLATAKIIILHMTYRFLFLSWTKNKITKLTFAQSSLVNFSSLYPSAPGHLALAGKAAAPGRGGCLGTLWQDALDVRHSSCSLCHGALLLGSDHPFVSRGDDYELQIQNLNTFLRGKGRGREMAPLPATEQGAGPWD